MQRIMVLGSGGAGKSTLARRLGEKLGLPVIHLDRLFWQPGWVEHDPETWPKKVSEVAAGERWVIDGNYTGTAPERFARADTVVFLDLPRWKCICSIILRSIHNLGRTRQDMGSGCPDKLDLDFILWVWGYPARSR